MQTPPTTVISLYVDAFEVEEVLLLVVVVGRNVAFGELGHWQMGASIVDSITAAFDNMWPNPTPQLPDKASS
jgi:hypothetical protein